jgi:hypothetical protein
MTWRPHALALLGCVVAALVSTPAWSAGIGANFTYGSSQGKVDDDGDFFSDINTSADLFEAGVSFDTNLAQDRLINYRVNANYQRVEQKLNQGAGKAHIDGEGFALNQLIGFGFVRTPRMRIFAGPTIHLGVAGFDSHKTVQGVRLEFDETLFTMALGPELGINYNVGRHFTVSVTGYYRYGLQSMYFSSPFSTSGSSNRYFSGDEHRVGVTTAFYFRFGSDQYKKRTRAVRKKPVEKADLSTEE